MCDLQNFRNLICFALITVILTVLPISGCKSKEEPKTQTAQNSKETESTNATDSKATAEEELNKLDIEINDATLYDYAAAGNAKVVGLLLEAGISPTSISPDGNTPLIAACSSGSLETVKELVEAGASVDEKGAKNFTPLMAAAFNNKKEIVKFLVSKGASIHEETTEGVTAYSIAGSNPNLLRILQQASPKEVALFDAARDGSKDRIFRLIDEGANPNARDERGDPILVTLIRSARPELALELIAKGGVKTNSILQNDGAPLNVACEQGQVEVVKALIAAGADVNSSSSNGLTPLHKAISSSRADIAKILIDAAADLNKNDTNGFSPLSTALRNDDVEMVKLLIDAGADVNKKDGQGMTPLQYATQNAPQCVDVLKDAGATE